VRLSYIKESKHEGNAKTSMILRSDSSESHGPYVEAKDVEAIPRKWQLSVWTIQSKMTHKLLLTKMKQRCLAPISTRIDRELLSNLRD